MLALHWDMKRSEALAFLSLNKGSAWTLLQGYTLFADEYLNAWPVSYSRDQKHPNAGELNRVTGLSHRAISGKKGARQILEDHGCLERVDPALVKLQYKDRPKNRRPNARVTVWHITTVIKKCADKTCPCQGMLQIPDGQVDAPLYYTPPKSNGHVTNRNIKKTKADDEMLRIVTCNESSHKGSTNKKLLKDSANKQPLAVKPPNKGDQQQATDSESKTSTATKPVKPSRKKTSSSKKTPAKKAKAPLQPEDLSTVDGTEQAATKLAVAYHIWGIEKKSSIKWSTHPGVTIARYEKAMREQHDLESDVPFSCLHVKRFKRWLKKTYPDRSLVTSPTKVGGEYIKFHQWVKEQEKAQLDIDAQFNTPHRTRGRPSQGAGTTPRQNYVSQAEYKRMAADQRAKTKAKATNGETTNAQSR